MYLDVEIPDRSLKERFNPLLRLARPEDAKDIVEIYRELYDGTYPYKEMEDEAGVRKMIESNTCDWVLFKDKSDTTLGCFTFLLDFKDRKGYIRGLMVRRKYQGILDVIKGVIGSYIGMYSKYKDRILRWYCENRTAHTKSQYALSLGGIKPIGFYPNKDIFLGKTESDIMHICYDERALREYRSPQIPHVLPEVRPCFDYSNERYRLGTIEYSTPKLKLDLKKIKNLKDQLQRTHSKDKFHYENITFSFKDSDSYFTFLYTPSVQNFEKTEYKIHNLEELFVFVSEFVVYQEQFGVRYSEIFLSAYDPSHQKIFLDAGFKPRGYIPSWKYNKEQDIFEDYILFNCFKGKVSEDIQLIEEEKELVKVLGLSPFEKSVLSSYKLIDKVMNNSYSAKIKHSFESTSNIKQCLKRSLGVYISLLFISYLIAIPFGYNPFLHTISELGSISLTPVPFIFDSACIFGGILNILLVFILGKTISDTINTSQLSRKYFGILNISLILNIFGAFSYSLLGLFSLDRGGPHGSLHGIFAMCAFLGFTLSITLISSLVISLPSRIPKYLGLNGLTMPILMCVLNCIFTIPLLEWLLLSSILLFLVPAYLKVLRN